MYTIKTNEPLLQFNSSKSYHRYLFGMVITDAVMEFATTHQCFWLFDMVASYQYQLHKDTFQVWTLKKQTDSSAWIVAEDSNGKILIKQQIKRTHFEVNQATVLVDGKVIMLSSED